MNTFSELKTLIETIPSLSVKSIRQGDDWTPICTLVRNIGKRPKRQFRQVEFAQISGGDEVCMRFVLSPRDETAIKPALDKLEQAGIRVIPRNDMDPNTRDPRGERQGSRYYVRFTATDIQSRKLDIIRFLRDVAAIRQLQAGRGEPELT